MRVLAAVVASSLLVSGCAANSYRIPSQDLIQLSQTPPEVRGQRVRVIQEISATDVPGASPVTSETVFVPNVNVTVVSGPRPRPVGGHGFGGVKGSSSGGSGGDGKAAAIAFLVIAAVALVAVAGVEGSRFDGWARLHPMHPVHLIGKDGNYTVLPLAWIDPGTAAWADKAIVKPTEGPWLTLDRAPLTRNGWTYSMYAGAGSLRSVFGDTELGTAFTVQGGYFPTQQLGIQASVFFGWRENQVQQTLFESRYSLEATFMPVAAGKFHAGLYGGLGYAYRYEDGAPTRPGNEGSNVLTGGAQLQLDLHTRIALTARFGIAQAHDEHMQDILIGLSVY